MLVERKCPLCREERFKIEKWGSRNLYLLTCLNENTAASMWVELNRRGRFQQVSVNRHPNPKSVMSSYQKQEYDKLQIPFWKLMGHKAKPQDIAREKMMKARNMTYGDLVLERNAGGEYTSGAERFRKLREESSNELQYQKR